MTSAMAPSVSMASQRAESEVTLTEIFVRGSEPIWSDSRLSFPLQAETDSGRLLTRSRYLSRYMSASASETHASPSRSTENAIPSSQSFLRPGSALVASVPAMNFSAMEVIWLDMVFVARPLAMPDARSPKSIPAGSLTPGCVR